MAKKTIQSTERDVPAAAQDLRLHLKQQMDEALEQMEEFGKEVFRTPLMRGFGIHPHGDRLQLRPFGTLLDSKSRKGGWREPFITWTYNTDDNRLEANAELPGTRRDDIKLDVGPDHIRLEAKGDHSNYRAFLEPGLSLDPDRAEATYRNGVLRVEVRVQGEAAKRVRHVDVDEA